MSSVSYNGNVVNSVVDKISQISNTIPSISSGIRSATNQIISAKGFMQYVGGISSDSFSSAVDKCEESIHNFSKQIRQKQVSVLAYSNDQGEINAFLDKLSRSEFDSLDLTELNDYIGLDRRAGNILKGLGSSVATFGLGLLEGIGNLFETGGDLVVLAGSGVATIFTGAADWITGGHLTKDMWEETKTFVSDKKVENIFNSLYDDTEVGNYLKDNAYYFNNVREIGSGVGYSAGMIGLSLLTGGLSSGLGVGAAGSVGAGQLAAVAGTLGFSRGTQNAWADGANIEQGLLYGTASGAWEGLQWYTGAKINQYGGLGDKIASGIFKGAASGVGTRIALDTIDSGLEGFVQPALTMIYKDYGQGNFIDNYKTAFEANGGWSSVGNQALMGGIMSGVSEYFGARRFLKAANAKESIEDAADDAAKKVFQGEGGNGQGKINTDDLDDLLDTSDDYIMKQKKYKTMDIDSGVNEVYGQAVDGYSSKNYNSLSRAQADLDYYRRINGIDVNNTNRVIGTAEKQLMERVEAAKIFARKEAMESVSKAQADLDNYRKYNNINSNDTKRVIGETEQALIDRLNKAKQNAGIKPEVEANNRTSYRGTKKNTPMEDLSSLYRKQYPQATDAQIKGRINDVFDGKVAVSSKEAKVIYDYIAKNTSGDVAEANRIFNDSFVRRSDGKYVFKGADVGGNAAGNVHNTYAKSAKQYTSFNDIVKDVDNPLDTNKVRQLASLFEKNPNANYKDLVTLNSKKAKIDPSINAERSFRQKFNFENGYFIEEQENYFVHVKQLKNYDFNVEARIYLNVGDYSDAYKFAMQFADECNSKGKGFYFKTGKSANGHLLENLTRYRDDTIVIYCSKNSIADYTNIVNETLRKTGIQLDDHPLLTGKIAGTKIGIGAEPVKLSGIESYNSLRAKIIKSAYETVDRNYRQYGIVKNSPEFYELYRKTIISIGQQYGIDPNNFCLEF